MSIGTEIFDNLIIKVFHNHKAIELELDKIRKFVKILSKIR